MLLREVLREELAQWVRVLPRLGLALLVLVVAWLLARLIAKAVGAGLSRSGLTPTHQVFFQRLTRWLVMLLGLAAALNVLSLQGLAAGLLAGGGLTAVVIGFAFREIGENLLAGFFLAFSRPFEVGHFIRSGDEEGTVRGIDLRTTHVRTLDGRDVFIPNAQIFNGVLENFTLDGLRRPGFSIGLDYRDDLDEAVRILGRAASAVPGVLADPPPEVALSSFEGAWVQIQVYFWMDTFTDDTPALVLRGAVMTACLRAVLEAGFTVSAETTTRHAVETTTTRAAAGS